MVSRVQQYAKLHGMLLLNSRAGDKLSLPHAEQSRWHEVHYSAMQCKFQQSHSVILHVHMLRPFAPRGNT